jgi:excisionase family DNA binding protein
MSLADAVPIRALYPMGEAATLLGVTRQYLYQLTYAGKLETVTLGKRRLVPAEELDRLRREGTK